MLPLLTAACLLLLAGESLAQLRDESTISTEGTQFVKPEPPPRPAPPVPPARPRTAAPRAPEPPVVKRPPRRAAPPPRYPSVVFLLDTSDSMLNKVPGKGTTRLDEAKFALSRVVQSMSRVTRMQLWTFNTRRKPVTIGGAPPGSFIAVGRPGLREQLARKIQGIRTAGGTNLYQAIIRTLDIFGAPADQPLYRSGQRFPVLVVISDGEDGGKTGHTLESVLAARRRYPLVTINTIGFHISGDEKSYQRLCRISTNPQGCATADNQQQLQKILESFYQPRG
ncbi:MAG: VWA domain-containing protein [SAR324 cluster bacterium]|nr:VWA domain-containing protein [SAR324 cluster bacterium]